MHGAETATRQSLPSGRLRGNGNRCDPDQDDPRSTRGSACKECALIDSIAHSRCAPSPSWWDGSLCVVRCCEKQMVGG